MSTTKGPDITKLGTNNYPQWKGEMQAWFRATQLWKLVSGDLQRPTAPNSIIAEHTAKYDQWVEKQKKAAGWIYLMVEQNQRIHLAGIEDDPV